jgi:predicted amidohydrolase
MKMVALVLFMVLSGRAFADGVVPIQEVFAPDPALYPADRFAKVAVVAWVSPTASPITTDPAVAEGVKQQNRATLAQYIREAAKNGAQLILTPEFGVVGYPDIPGLPPEEDNFQNPAQIAPYAEPVPGVSTQFFSSLATELHVYIQFGLAEEASPGHYHNTAVVVGPSGKIEAVYRKIHLYQLELQFLEPGTEPVTYTTPFGKLGIVLCSDVYSDPPLSEYKNQKVDALALSTSWAQYNTGWGTFTSTATQLSVYLLAANQTYFPDSGVINPDGSIQSHIRQSTGVAYGYLPLHKTAPTFGLKRIK